jgi:hypothetical protein
MRLRAAVALGLGAGLALVAQLVSPVGVPLYDGLTLNEPYRYLEPAAGQPGQPMSFRASPGLDAGGTSRSFAAATTENPPQAQLIALPGAFVPPAGATTMQVAIDAVVPSAKPTTGSIAGNVYRFSVTDDVGNPFTLAGGAQPTLTLRGPDGVTDAVIGHLTPAGWQALVTEHGGGLGLFTVVPTELGDYVVLAGVSAPSDLTTPIAVGLSFGLPLLVAIAYFIRRSRRDRLGNAAAETARSKARVPSKRRTRRR